MSQNPKYKSNHPDPMLSSVQEIVAGLAAIDRNHFQPSSDRRENDIEHSFAVAMLCWYVIDKHNLALDKAKVLQYALCHDFVELYAGDINTFASAADRKKKAENEARALKKFAENYKNFPELISTMEAYEAKEDEESLFVWTVDKIQALVMDDLSDWRAHAVIGVKYKQFQEKVEEQLGKSSPYAKLVYESFIQYSYHRFYDQPKKKA